MYLAYYQLKEKPFDASPNPKFLWLTAGQKRLLAVLQAQVRASGGLFLVAGAAGTGKTTLINALLSDLGEAAVAACVPYPELDPLDFINFIADALNFERDFKSPDDFEIHYHRFLDQCFARQRQLMLIVDEAHQLDRRLILLIERLAAIENRVGGRSGIFLVGQNKTGGNVADLQNGAFGQKIRLRYRTRLLKAAETANYIRHRLKVAGGTRNIFTDAAIEKIFHFSHGCQRLVNSVCDRALLTGYVKGLYSIGVATVKECADELHFTSKAPMI